MTFVESIRRDLLGLIITHAHEDHIGALADLWPRLGCQVYATQFAAGLLEVKRLNEPGAPKIPMTIMKPGDRLELGPFQVEIVSMAHSIPESTGLVLRTPLGTVVHTGDWKIDATPLVGTPDRREAPARDRRRGRARARLRLHQHHARRASAHPKPMWPTRCAS